MAQQTKIEWTDQSWNFLRGCRRVSPGCENCYAERQAIRHAGPGGSYEGLVRSTPNGPRWTGKLSFHEDILLAPLKRKTPTKYFVNSMSDLFYEDVTDEMLDKAFAVMALCPQHIFQILTKRPERMKAYFETAKRPPVGTLKPEYWRQWQVWSASVGMPIAGQIPWTWNEANCGIYGNWPLPNVWLGVSVENQEYADKRIPLLLDTPAAVRWISAEPLLGPIDLHPKALPGYAMLSRYYGPNGFDESGSQPVCDRQEKYFPRLDWVVVGGESGPRSRKCDIANIRSIVEQCKAADVPVFVKQLGANFQDAVNGVGGVQTVTPDEYGPLTRRLTDRKGGDMNEWPEDLRVREFPNVESGKAAAV